MEFSYLIQWFFKH